MAQPPFQLQMQQESEPCLHPTTHRVCSYCGFMVPDDADRTIDDHALILACSRLKRYEAAEDKAKYLRSLFRFTARGQGG